MSKLLESINLELNNRATDAANKKTVTDRLNKAFEETALSVISDWFGPENALELSKSAAWTCYYNEKTGAFESAKVFYSLPDALELAPFTVYYGPKDAARPVYADSWSSAAGTAVRTTTGMDTLVQARKLWPAYKAHLDDKAERARYNRINGLEGWYIPAYDERDITAYHEELMTLAPALAAQKMNERRRRIQARKEYKAAYAAWWNERSAVLDHNQKVVSDYEDALNESFTVVYVRYGIAVQGPTGDIVGQEEVVTLGRGAGNEWIVIGPGGKLQPWTFTHIVGYSAGHTVDVQNFDIPCPEVHIGDNHKHGFGTSLRARPGSDVAALKAAIEGDLKEVPQEPDIPAALDWQGVDATRREVWQERRAAEQAALQPPTP